MEMQEIEITIDKEGRIQVKVTGAHGADCLAITKNLRGFRRSCRGADVFTGVLRTTGE